MNRELFTVGFRENLGAKITLYPKKIKKFLCPAVPLRGLEAGIYHIQVIFMVCVRTVCEPDRFMRFSPEPFLLFFDWDYYRIPLIYGELPDSTAIAP